MWWKMLVTLISCVITTCCTIIFLLIIAPKCFGFRSSQASGSWWLLRCLGVVNKLFPLSIYRFNIEHFPFSYITYLWSRVILEKLNGSQILKKFPAFNGTRRFVTGFTSARHLSLSHIRPIQSMAPHPNF